MAIGKDKIQHFVVCFTPPLFLGEYGVCASAGLAVGKEYGDSKAIGNKWDWLDIAADAAGTILGYGTNILIRTICF